MGTVISLADKSTAWLAPSVAAARQGAEVLRATWEAMAAAGNLPGDIDVSDPGAIDWQRIADVLLTMAEFEQRVLMGELPDAGGLVEAPLPTR
jgi:hypothetical protein